MRLCIAVGDERLVTMSSSEPILSDAASKIMHDYGGNRAIPQALSRLLTGCSIHTGDRGEWAGVLLAILARDEVVHRHLSSHPDPGFFPVIAFLKRLLAIRDLPASDLPASSRKASSKTTTEDILAAKPSVFRDDSMKDTPLAKVFDGVFVHFNHFVKRGTHGLTPQQLLGFFLRNAAFMAANSQVGIDFGIVLCKGCQVIRTSTSLLLVQVKNDKKFSAKVKEELFNAMDPVSLGLATENHNVPIIRIVMALAGKKPALKYVKSQRKGNFTAYDIWASGLTEDVFPIVGDNPAVWRDVVQASDSYNQGMRGGDKAVKELKMTMMPMAGDLPHFWEWMKDGGEKGFEESNLLRSPTGPRFEDHAGPSRATLTRKRSGSSSARSPRKQLRFDDES